MPEQAAKRVRRRGHRRAVSGGIPEGGATPAVVVVPPLLWRALVFLTSSTAVGGHAIDDTRAIINEYMMDPLTVDAAYTALVQRLKAPAPAARLLCVSRVLGIVKSHLVQHHWPSVAVLNEVANTLGSVVAQMPEGDRAEVASRLAFVKAAMAAHLAASTNTTESMTLGMGGAALCVEVALDDPANRNAASVRLQSVSSHPIAADALVDVDAVVGASEAGVASVGDRGAALIDGNVLPLDIALSRWSAGSAQQGDDMLAHRDPNKSEQPSSPASTSETAALDVRDYVAVVDPRTAVSHVTAVLQSRVGAARFVHAPAALAHYLRGGHDDGTNGFRAAKDADSSVLNASLREGGSHYGNIDDDDDEESDDDDDDDGSGGRRSRAIGISHGDAVENGADMSALEMHDLVARVVQMKTPNDRDVGELAEQLARCWIVDGVHSLPVSLELLQALLCRPDIATRTRTFDVLVSTATVFAVAKHNESMPLYANWLLSELVVYLHDSRENSEAVWRSALGATMLLSTSEGKGVLSCIRALHPRALRYMLERCVIYRWSSSLHAFLCRAIGVRMYDRDNSSTVSLSLDALRMFGGMRSLMHQLLHAPSLEASRTLFGLLVEASLATSIRSTPTHEAAVALARALATSGKAADDVFPLLRLEQDDLVPLLCVTLEPHVTASLEHISDAQRDAILSLLPHVARALEMAVESARDTSGLRFRDLEIVAGLSFEAVRARSHESLGQLKEVTSLLFSAEYVDRFAGASALFHLVRAASEQLQPHAAFGDELAPAAELLIDPPVNPSVIPGYPLAHTVLWNTLFMGGEASSATLILVVDKCLLHQQSLGADISCLVATLHTSVRWVIEASKARWREYSERLNSPFSEQGSGWISKERGRATLPCVVLDSYLVWAVEALLRIVATPCSTGTYANSDAVERHPYTIALLDGRSLVTRRALDDIPQEILWNIFYGLSGAQPSTPASDARLCVLLLLLGQLCSGEREEAQYRHEDAGLYETFSAMLHDDDIRIAYHASIYLLHAVKTRSSSEYRRILRKLVRSFFPSAQRLPPVILPVRIACTAPSQDGFASLQNAPRTFLRSGTSFNLTTILSAASMTWSELSQAVRRRFGSLPGKASSLWRTSSFFGSRRRV